MTTPAISQRQVSALAALVHEIRDEWDEAGIAAAIRKVDPAIPLSQLVIAAARYAEDDGNTTPAHLSDITNRAWDSDWYLPCRLHPEQRARRTSGECASCAADRMAVAEPLPQTRPGRPIPPEARQQMVAAIRGGERGES